MKNYLGTLILLASLGITTLFLVVFAAPAQALMLQFSLQELASGADTIIVGSVTQSTSQWNIDRSHIETRVTLSVEEYLKGALSDSQFTVTVPGGEVAGITENVSDTPRFDQGERAVVFLKHLSQGIEVYGGYQGKLSIAQGPAGVQYLAQLKEDIKQAVNGPFVPSPTEWRPAAPSVLDVTKMTDTALESSPPASTLTYGWQTITSLDFESGLGAGWSVLGNPTWGPTTYNPYAGSYSGWCARGGALGVDPATNNYPNNISPMLVYGPFDLSDASAAELSFSRWLNSEESYDYLHVIASLDGFDTFDGYSTSGIYDSWQPQSYDLTNWPGLGNLCGRSQVWIAFVFTSDASYTYKGAFLDNIVLRKYVAPAQISQISPPSASAGTNTQVTITGSGFGVVPGTVNFFYQLGEPDITGTIISWSDTSIVTTVPTGDINGYPASASSGPVYVHTSSGDSPPVPFTVTFSYGGEKWAAANPIVNFLINPNTADCSGEELAVQSAAATWNAVPGKSFTLNYAGATSATGASLSSYNGLNEILWSDSGSTGNLAVAHVWTENNNITETDMEFNDFYAWSTATNPLPEQYDVQSIALHEMGHWLRLGDLYGDVLGYPQDVNKVMYGFGSPGTTLRTLNAADMAGIQYIYPSAVNKIVFTSTAQSLTAGSVSSVITIQTQDVSGSPADVTADTTVYLASTSAAGRFDTSASGSFNGTITSVIIPSGSNSTSFYYRDTATGTPTITAFSAGMAEGTQQETVVSGAPASLVFSTQPSVNNIAGVSFSTQPVVTVQDAWNNTATTSNVPVTLEITPGSGTSGAILSGIVTVNAVNGVVTFSGLSINLGGKNYTLKATSSPLIPATSNAFGLITRGDANEDGVINMGDATRVMRIVLGLDPLTMGADANGDGIVNMGDVTKIMRIILGLS